jgi:hypothetical protein
LPPKSLTQKFPLLKSFAAKCALQEKHAEIRAYPKVKHAIFPRVVHVIVNKSEAQRAHLNKSVI